MRYAIKVTKAPDGLLWGHLPEGKNTKETHSVKNQRTGKDWNEIVKE